MTEPGTDGRDFDIGTRVAKLEADVTHIRDDLAEIKRVLGRLAPRVDEMFGIVTSSLPGLARRADLGALRQEVMSDMGGLDREIATRIDGIRLEARSDVATLQREMKAGFADLHKQAQLDREIHSREMRSDLERHYLQMKAELADNHQKLTSEIAANHQKLTSEIASLRVETISQILMRPTRRQSVFDVFAIVGLIGVVLPIGSRVAH